MMRLGCQPLRSRLAHRLPILYYLQDKTSWIDLVHRVRINFPLPNCKIMLHFFMCAVNTVTEVQVEGTTCSSSALCAVNTSTEVPAEGRINCSSVVIHETSKKVQEVIVLPLQPMTTMTVAHQSAVIYTGDITLKKPTKDNPVNCRQGFEQNLHKIQVDPQLQLEV